MTGCVSDTQFELQSAYLQFFGASDRLLKEAENVRRERDRLMRLIQETTKPSVKEETPCA